MTRLAGHAEVLRQVERPDEGEPEPWGGEDRVERTETVGTFDLHAGDHVVLGLPAIVGEGHRAVPGGAHHRRRAAPADRWVVRRADHRRGLVGRADARCQHTVGAGVEGSGDLVDGDVRGAHDRVAPGGARGAEQCGQGIGPVLAVLEVEHHAVEPDGAEGLDEIRRGRVDPRSDDGLAAGEAGAQ